jgi:AcrR family transcriptional regulator/DNA-binding MarR family transcriptional regulator
MVVVEMARASSIRGGSSNRAAAQRLAGFERERITEIQRARILAAMAAVACERGAGNVTVAHVVERAGVSRRTFYEAFSDSEECFLAAFDRALANARVRVMPVYEEHALWRERIRASLACLLWLFDEQPQFARLLVVESLSGGRLVFERRARVLEALIGVVDEGRAGTRDQAGVTRLTAEGVVGAVLSVIHARIVTDDGGEGPLAELLNSLMAIVVLPYLGVAQVRHELDRPLPAVPAHGDGPGAPLESDPFKDAGMRLTYRTMLVLGTIAAHPGCSNRQIGEAAGVNDQGQMSKLLARLKRLGLIANSGQGHAKGEPNAWSLTATGRQVEQSIRAHTNASTNDSKTPTGRER